MMDSDHHHHSQQQQQQYQYQHHFQDLQRALQPPRLLQQQPTSGGGGGGLTRYRSAPSSYFASYLDTIDTSSVMINNNSSSGNNEKHDFNQPRPLSPETESIIAKFMNSVDGGGGGSSDPLPTKLCDIPENSPVQGAEFMVSVKREAQQIIQPTELLQQQTIQQQPIQQQHQTNFSSSPQVIYSPNKPPLAKQNLNNSPVSSNSSVENSPFGTSSSMFMDSIKINGSISSASNHGSSSFRASLDSINPTTSQQMMIGVGGSGMSPKPGIPSPFRNPISGNGTSSSASSPFRSPTTTMDSLNQQMMKSGSGLVRHSSLPAGFLANINLDDGFAALRNMGTNNTNKNNSNRASNNDSSFATPGRLNGQMNFSSGLPSSSNGIDHRSFTNSIKSNNCNNNGSNENGDGYLTGFPIGSWDDSMLLSNDFSNLDDDDDDDHKGFSDLNSSENNNQNREAGNRPPALLAHHLSLPKNAMEKLLHFQDSVPCKIRAKRGMATHPRSIAERVRRTKISERMRKLQDLVPYMDKQTNTADMLDLAVEYIKDLQKQVKVLADNRARCTCSS